MFSLCAFSTKVWLKANILTYSLSFTDSDACSGRWHCTPEKLYLLFKLRAALTSCENAVRPTACPKHVEDPITYEVTPGAWRREGQLVALDHLTNPRARQSPKNLRRYFMEYYNSPAGSAAWRNRIVPWTELNNLQMYVSLLYLLLTFFYSSQSLDICMSFFFFALLTLNELPE